MDAVLNPGKRRRGRPPSRSDADTRRLLGAAAAAAFARHGYAGTNVAAVAGAAGVSTRTLYRLVPTKAELFELSVGERIDRFLLAVDETELAALHLDEALTRILIEHATLVMSPETIAISRLLYAESDRFPEIAARYHAAGVSRVDGAIARWLARQQRAGALRLADPGTASGLLRGAMVGDLQRVVLLGLEPPPDAAAIAERARHCAALFLDGCRA